MIGNNHKWDIESAPFWKSECGKYTCATMGNPVTGKGYMLVPKRLGLDWDDVFDAIREEYGDELHRFPSSAEARKAFSTLSVKIRC